MFRMFEALSNLGLYCLYSYYLYSLIHRTHALPYFHITMPSRYNSSIKVDDLVGLSACTGSFTSPLGARFRGYLRGRHCHGWMHTSMPEGW